MLEKEFTISQLFVLRDELDEILEENKLAPFVLRYKLTSLHTIIQDKIKIADNMKAELIRKYGVPKLDDPTYISVEQTIEVDGIKVPNPKFEGFVKEFTPILEQKEKIEYKELKLSSFEGFVTKYNPNVLRELIIEE